VRYRDRGILGDGRAMDLTLDIEIRKAAEDDDDDAA
jgi:hypothetical protein